jgi:NADH:ubiquinone oxidoreductase subunit C
MTTAMTETDIIQGLSELHPDVKVRLERDRRLWLDVPRRRAIEVIAYLHDELGFTSLCTITGLDSGDKFELIYHLAADNGIVANVKVTSPRTNPDFETVTDIYKGGMLYELEARNLLGLRIRGIPDDIRYPLPDDWPKGEFPLRKDWVLPGADDDTEEEDGDG